MPLPSQAFRDLNLLSTAKNFTEIVTLAENLEPVYQARQLGEMRPLVFSKEKVDKTAETLLASHYTQENAKPILTRGDGNCLFNAASLAICGSDKLSIELRVRTVIELAAHQNYYLNHPTVLNCGLKKKWRIMGCSDDLLCSNFRKHSCHNAFYSWFRGSFSRRN